MNKWDHLTPSQMMAMLNKLYEQGDELEARREALAAEQEAKRKRPSPKPELQNREDAWHDRPTPLIGKGLELPRDRTGMPKDVIKMRGRWIPSRELNKAKHIDQRNGLWDAGYEHKLSQLVAAVLDEEAWLFDPSEIDLPGKPRWVVAINLDANVRETFPLSRCLIIPIEDMWTCFKAFLPTDFRQKSLATGTPVSYLGPTSTHGAQGQLHLMRWLWNTDKAWMLQHRRGPFYAISENWLEVPPRSDKAKDTMTRKQELPSERNVHRQWLERRKEVAKQKNKLLLPDASFMFNIVPQEIIDIKTASFPTYLDKAMRWEKSRKRRGRPRINHLWRYRK